VRGDFGEEVTLEESSMMRSKARKDFEQELATNLALPVHLLKVSYPKLPNAPELLRVPYGWTVDVRPQE
jgi:hypothetical protein